MTTTLSFARRVVLALIFGVAFGVTAALMLTLFYPPPPSQDVQQLRADLARCQEIAVAQRGYVGYAGRMMDDVVALLMPAHDSIRSDVLTRLPRETD